MKWKEDHPVSVKKLVTEAVRNGQLDLIINELKIYRRIAHSPKILTLMGFCQCDNVENLYLVFERISIGSSLTQFFACSGTSANSESRNSRSSISVSGDGACGMALW